MKILNRLALMLTLAFAASGGAFATILQTAGPQSGNEAFNSVGVQFTVLAPISITQLGIFDDNFGNGIQGSLTAQLFSSGGGSPLLSATFTGTSDTLVSGYRFKPIAPLFLTTGTYVLAGFGFTASDRQNSSYNGGTVEVFDNGGGLLQFDGATYGGGSDAPGTLVLNGPLATNYFAGANMVYQGVGNVPEPASLALLALGLLGLGFSRRKQV